MRPVIGITTHLSDDERTMQLGRTYSDVLLQLGVLPILLPATTDAQIIAQYAQEIDGLLLSGGGDMDPLLFGEETDWACGTISPVRDDFELKLCAALLRSSGKPILGICRGFQVLNVALGGTLYQDILTGMEGRTLSHRQKQRAVYASHSATVTPGTKLHAIAQADTIMVNSLHHQAVKAMPDGFIASAIAPDGIVEAAELKGHPFCIGVQWHPELLWNQPGGEVNRRLFKAFADACRHPNVQEFTIRAETSADHHASELMTQRAFWNLHHPGCDEHYLVHRLRSDEAYVPELTRVAETDGQIIGLIMYARAKLVCPDGTAKEVLTFGPLAVDPAYQNRGVGSALLRETLGAARDLGYKAVIIFGEPGYYPRFGFRTCDHWGVTTADGRNFDAFMGVELQPGSLNYPGAHFHEAEVYSNLDADEVEVFHRCFPHLDKLRLPGQWD